MNRMCESAILTTATFPSIFGWTAVVWRGGELARIAFGSRTREAALRRAGVSADAMESLTPEMQDLIARLEQFAAGNRDDFLDISLDWSGRTRFQCTVLKACRQIPYGQVLSYGQLAARAGSPRSARAVGNVMACNLLPLIIPCHRVVAAGGALGGFSAPNGTRLKRQLLKLEGAAIE